MKKIHIIMAVVPMLTACVCTSCHEYSDDIQDLGKRVVVLEDSALIVNNRVELLQKLIEAMQTHGVVSDIRQNRDGSTTIYFTDGRQPITFNNGTNGADGNDGQDGRDAGVLLGVQKGTDGIYYWTFNGDWLLDKDGNRVAAQPTDGKDGKDGKDGEDGKDGKDAEPVSDNIVLPQMRISDGRTWEISLDGGKTWTDTGVDADGKDGKDGEDGKDGKDGEDGEDPPYFLDTIVTETELILIIEYNGQVTTLCLPRLT